MRRKENTIRKLLFLGSLALILVESGCLTDRTPPTITILNRADGDTVLMGQTTILGRATDNKAIAKVEIDVDDSLVGIATYQAEDSRYIFDWDNTAKRTWTQHEVKAIGYDAAGNAGADSVWLLVGNGTGPTAHIGDIDSDQFWHAHDNPHIVAGSINVRSGATLTIAPGCVIKFDSCCELSCGADSSGGAIVAVGTPDSIILFTSNQPTPSPGDWLDVGVYGNAGPGTRFSWCTFEYGGGKRFPDQNGMLHLESPECRIEDCLIRLSDNYGIYSRAGVEFSSFRGNTITQCGRFPLRIQPERPQDIGPDNSFSGNAAGYDAIELGSAGVVHDAVWPDLQVPYRVDGCLDVQAKLTIEPGCVIRLGPEAGLRILGSSSCGVSAEGTYERPIAFIADSPNPDPEDHWDDIDVKTGKGSLTFRYCTFEHGGRHRDVIHLDSGFVSIRNCTIRDNLAGGVRLECAELLAFSNNIVTRCQNWPLVVPADGVASVDTNNVLVGNIWDGVIVLGGSVGEASWFCVGVPYFICGDIRVQGVGNVLHIKTGTILYFDPGIGMYCDAGTGIDADGRWGRISFTTVEYNHRPGEWAGLSFWDAGGPCLSRLIDCNVEYAGASGHGSIYLNNANAEMRGDSIRFSSNYGIYLDGATYPDTTLLRANNWFEGNPSGDIYHP